MIATPNIVPIFFGADPDRAAIESFLRALPSSTYWKTVTALYGVGETKVAPSVVVSESLPATLSDGNARAWLETHLDGPSAPLGAPDPSAIYVLFVPRTTTFGFGSSVSCKDLGGYHSFTRVGATGIAYALVGRCAHLGGLSGLDVVTVGASHELIEAATNPSIDESPAFGTVDDDHVAWAMEPGAEVADMCDRFSDAYIKPDDLGFMVERVWSNASAAAGHHPCVPVVPGEVYFNVIPSFDEPVSVKVGNASSPGRGVRVPVGSERTVDVTFVSDGPSDAWEVRAESALERTPTLELSFPDGATARGRNGDVVPLRIRARARGTFGGSVIRLTSTLGDRRTIWMGFVAN